MKSFKILLFCDTSPSLENSCMFFCDLALTKHNCKVCFRRKAFLKSDTVAGKIRILYLKWCIILVCLRNFNYEIFVVLNLEPCNFTGCWLGGTLASHISQRSYMTTDP